MNGDKKLLTNNRKISNKKNLCPMQKTWGFIFSSLPSPASIPARSLLRFFYPILSFLSIHLSACLILHTPSFPIPLPPPPFTLLFFSLLSSPLPSSLPHFSTLCPFSPHFLHHPPPFTPFLAKFLLLFLIP